MNSFIIAGNVIKRLMKEINAFTFLLLFPVMAGVLAVLMFGSGTTDIAIANVPKNDFGIVKFLEDTGNYTIHQADSKQIKDMVENEKVSVGIVFSDNPVAGKNKTKLISVKNDEKVQQLSAIVDGYFKGVAGGKPAKENLKQPEINKKIQQPKMAIGMLSLFIIMFVGTGMGMLLEDKRCKTFMRTFCAPLRQYEAVLGHLMANFLLGTVQIGVFLTVTTLVLKIEWGTSVLNIFVILLIYLITAIGLGIGVAGFVKDHQKYNVVLMLIAVSTSFMGGSFFPLELLNDFVNKIANFLPQKWVMDSYVKLVQGNNLADIQTNLLILVLFGLVLFTFGIKVLKPTTEDV